MFHRYIAVLAIALTPCLASAQSPDADKTIALPDYPALYHQFTIDLQPGNNNGWDLLMRIADLHREIGARHVDGTFSLHESGYVDYTLAWDPESLDDEYTIDTQLPRIQEQLADARASGLFALLETLAEKDAFIQPAEDTPLLDLNMSQFGPVRALAYLNGARMALAAEAGDDDEFAAACNQLIWLGRFTPRSSPLAIGSLVGIAAESLAMERIRHAILRKQVSPALAAQLLHTFDAAPPMLSARDTLDAERLLRLDSITRLYTDDGQGNGEFSPEAARQLQTAADNSAAAFPSPAQNTGSTGFASKAEMLDREAEIHGRLIAIIEAPPQLRTAVSDRLENDLNHEGVLGTFLSKQAQADSLLHILVPSMGRAADTHDQYTLYLAATRIMLAIEIHRSQTGSVPESLDGLRPVLGTIPLAPFTDEPPVYRPDPSNSTGYVLYSMGYDRTDNQGHVASDLRHPVLALRAGSTGSDYVFVPDPAAFSP